MTVMGVIYSLIIIFYKSIFHGVRNCSQCGDNLFQHQFVTLLYQLIELVIQNLNKSQGSLYHIRGCSKRIASEVVLHPVDIPEDLSTQQS